MSTDNYLSLQELQNSNVALTLGIVCEEESAGSLALRRYVTSIKDRLISNHGLYLSRHLILMLKGFQLFVFVL